MNESRRKHDWTDGFQWGPTTVHGVVHGSVGNKIEDRQTLGGASYD